MISPLDITYSVHARHTFIANDDINKLTDRVESSTRSDLGEIIWLRYEKNQEPLSNITA